MSNYLADDHREGFTQDQVAALMQPLQTFRVKSRRQSGTDLSYVEAYDIKATLIRMFGFGGFSAEVIESRIIDVRTAETHPGHTARDGSAKTPQVLALSTVKLTIHATGAVYTETAIGSNSMWDIGDAADNAIKSAASDALKRAATYLGSQFGLSLYNEGRAYEVVQVMFEPEQRGMLAETLEANAEQTAQQQAEAQARINAATGQPAGEQPTGGQQ